VAVFCIDTSTGQVATFKQLVEAGVAASDAPAPPKPWYPIKGTGDATTMWYAVMRKQTKGVYIGALCLRHTDHHALLEKEGYQEVPVEEIRQAM
jgi:hypothetical protein